jgi:phosphoglycolate phosphatase
MTSIGAVIFDFDGTLAELTIDFAVMRRQVGALAEAFLDEPAPTGSEPVLEWIEGVSRRIGDHDRSQGLEFASRCRLLITAVEMKAAKAGNLFGFTRSLLHDLAGQGIKRGIITRNCSAAVKQVFPELSSHCDVFLAREDVPRVKPHPEHLFQAIQALNGQPGRSLMVGDHVMDIQVAKRCGVLSAAVTSGTMTREQLQAEGPDFLVEHAGQLPAVLESAGLL